MMKKLNQKLSEVLDIDPIPIESSENQIVESNTELLNSENQINDDTEFARQNLIDLIDKGNNAVDHIIRVAIESEHPRAYEVASGLIKNLSDLNKDLLEIQKRRKDLMPKSADSKNVNIDKAVFIGSTTDLIKMLKQSKKEEQ